MVLLIGSLLNSSIHQATQTMYLFSTTLGMPSANLQIPETHINADLKEAILLCQVTLAGSIMNKNEY